MIKVGIITASDKGARGEREDLSVGVIRELIATINGQVEAYEIIPDEQVLLEEKLKEYSDKLNLDLVFTTGGTGFAKRDVTPEATLKVAEKLVPGISEVMRGVSLKVTPHGMLSRAVAVIRGETLIVNLPGSPKAVRECLGAILPALPHGIQILKGETGECGSPK